MPSQPMLNAKQILGQRCPKKKDACNASRYVRKLDKVCAAVSRAGGLYVCMYVMYVCMFFVVCFSCFLSLFVCLFDCLFVCLVVCLFV